MFILNYDDYWINYVLKADPQEIKRIIKENYIVSDGLKIHLDIYDNETSIDKTIIFVHGTSVYSRFYVEWCYNLFQKGFRIVAPDLPGHGMSEGKRGHFTMEKFTKTIYDVVTHILEKYRGEVVVMGSSLGGITALYSAARDPRLKGAICHNAAIFNEGAYKKIIKLTGILKILAPVIPYLAKIAPTLKLSVFLYLDFNKLAKSSFIDRLDYILKDKLLSYKYSLTALRAQMKEPLARPIESIETPIMIINGDEDYLFSVEYMREIYDRLTSRNKQLEILKGTSHLIFQENIDEVMTLVIPWLNKIF